MRYLGKSAAGNEHIEDDNGTVFFSIGGLWVTARGLSAKSVSGLSEKLDAELAKHSGPKVGMRVKCAQVGCDGLIYGEIKDVQVLTYCVAVDRVDADIPKRLLGSIMSSLIEEFNIKDCWCVDESNPAPIPTNCRACKKPNEWQNQANRGQEWECCECKIMRDA